MNVEIEFGRGTVTLEVGDGRLAGVLEPRPAEPLADPAKAIETSLEQPLGSPPLEEVLRGKESALILTVGQAYPSPRDLLLPILRRCQAQDVFATICIAHGARRQMTPAELKNHLGADLVLGPVVQQDAWSDELHIERGVTSRGTPVRLNRYARASRMLLAVGFVEPSQRYGFAGAKDLVVPGIAHHLTISANHRWLFHPDAQVGMMYGNPVSDDAEEAAAQAPLLWVTHAVLSAERKPTRVISGRPRRAHLAACRAARGIYEAPRRQAKIVVASAGGNPGDFDLSLAAEALAPAARMVEPGGAIVLVAECGDGWGPEPALREWLCERSPQEILEQAPSSAASALGVHGAYLAAQPAVEKGAAVILVTSAEMAAAMDGSFVRACTDLGEAMRLAQSHAGDAASVAVLRHGRRMILA